MLMAKVIGSVVSTQKDSSLVGKKLMIVQPVDSDKESIRFHQVAADTVGAGVGDYVLLTIGSSAKQMFQSPSEAVDAAIVGIIDTFDK
ncbi:Carboxysome shell and ethanolamine utilization microcompartment protein CcmK/EutM [Pilibacter termitis]|uniref:Carboxysome shell and ethanolamine utilization microcompartment protein CcmK/EutM n=1 Tax=Pilibacter termitis TaxID=263852 RepID=A0A1T4MJC9_9ENTE|nr:EutN/CcmL family microcompartment protein [Pilibacter termitis]SJZ67200.1 Carboxysome shell and ethanolamine utilization microcompartment protein CcmK/EutM [Pilibacter termitis]